MGKLNEIRDKLLAGSTTKQLVEQGYAKSSVFSVAKKLANTKPDMPASSVQDELQDLRRQREIMKLQKEIAGLEADKEKLPDRMEVLESRLTALESWCDGDLVDAIGDCIFAAWRAADRSKEDATEVSLIKKAELKRKA